MRLPPPLPPLWPRTVVADDAVALANETVPFLIRKDSEGQSFLDYLEYCSRDERWPDHPYDEHKACIIAGLSEFDLQPVVRAKYEWLGRYHNQKLSELAQRDDSRHIIRDRMFIANV